LRHGSRSIVLDKGRDANLLSRYRTYALDPGRNLIVLLTTSF